MGLTMRFGVGGRRALPAFWSLDASYNPATTILSYFLPRLHKRMRRVEKYVKKFSTVLTSILRNPPMFIFEPEDWLRANLSDRS